MQYVRYWEDPMRSEFYSLDPGAFPKLAIGFTLILEIGATV